ncbi:class I SAM-dependent methyltransferase [Ningiella sp. W23]|uniref:class I SAM-dependent methyltransferase n=1 Tax=Ningiella sp. W23 TaxID=3023715 RepID=UPI003756B383
MRVQLTMNEDVKQHYQKLYETHGRDHNAVQYSSKDSQFARFEILLDVADEISSVADMGCGLGDLLPLLRQRHPHASYQGYDFVDGFVSDASVRFSNDDNASFHHFDVMKDDIKQGADYVVLSGMLNNLMTDNAYFTEVTLNKMWQAANKGIAFNALSHYVDYQDEGLYYQDPLKLFDYCKRHFSKYVALRHDYDVKENSIPFEFTIYVYKK